MSNPTEQKAYPVEEAVRAQKALRKLAGLEPEQFPIQAFVGMISDEVEALRKLGHTDEQIAEVIRESSAIALTARDIEENYAPPAERHGAHG